MTILVVGSTGTIGKLVVGELSKRGVETHALVRKIEDAKFPPGVKPVVGDLTDVRSMRAALKDVTTLFLLNAVTPDEVTQALITLGIARDFGIQRIVYFSVIHSDKYTDVPHFTGKFTAERMIEQSDMAATILRPAYFMQNDLTLKDAIENGVYPQPIGSTGAAMADARDIAETAAVHLVRREQSPQPLPREVLDIAGPDALTGVGIATLWSEAIGKRVSYGGDDLDAFERNMGKFAPSWAAYDMKQMMRRIQTDGMLPEKGDQERLVALLGRSLRSYRDFTLEAVAAWAAR